jgi:hypothetical protein
MTESGLTPADLGPGDAPPDGIQTLLTEEIKQIRENIGETVAALAPKADFVARAREKASVVAGRLKDTVGKVKKQVAAVPPPRQAILGAACVVLLASVLIARHRRR